jgi:serine/threonine protein kinase
MNITLSKRSHSERRCKSYIGHGDSYFSKPRRRTKLPSMTAIDDKDQLLVEYLRLNDIGGTFFFSDEDVERIRTAWSTDDLPLVKQFLRQHLRDFTSNKQKFLSEIFEKGDRSTGEYEEIFRNIHNYYLLQTLLSSNPSHRAMPSRLKQAFAQQSKLIGNRLEMDLIMKPIKCRICYSFVPVWLYVEHSNNCFGLNSLKNELNSINAKILGLCDVIKDQTSFIKYEEIIKNKKEDLERETSTAMDKQRVTDSLRKSFGTKQTKQLLTMNTPKEEVGFGSGSRENSVCKNGHSKSIFNSYKNESKINSNDPSFSVYAKVHKQKTIINGEIQSMHAKYDVTPSVRRLRQGTDQSSTQKKLAPQFSELIKMDPKLNHNASEDNLNKKQSKKLRLGNDSSSPLLDESAKNGCSDDEGFCAGDNFNMDDIEDTPGNRNFVPSGNHIIRPTGKGFPKKTLTDYKNYKNTFDINFEVPLPTKKVNKLPNNDFPNGPKAEDKPVLPDKKSKRESKVIAPVNLFNKESISSNDKGSPLLVRRFMEDKSSKDLSVDSNRDSKKSMGKNYDLQNSLKKIQITEPDQKKSEKNIIAASNIPFGKFFSFKTNLGNDDDSNKKELNRISFANNSNGKADDFGKISLFAELASPMKGQAKKGTVSNNQASQNFKGSPVRFSELQSRQKDRLPSPDNINDKSSVESQEVSLNNITNRKKIVEYVNDLSGSERSEFDHEDSDEANRDRKQRGTAITFGTGLDQKKKFVNNFAGFSVSKTKGMLLHIASKDSMREVDEHDYSSKDFKGSGTSCVGDMFDDHFDGKEQPKSQSSCIDAELLKKVLKSKEKKEPRSKKGTTDFDPIGSGSRNSFTNPVKHSSFYHMHRNSIQNTSLNLKDRKEKNDESDNDQNSNSKSREEKSKSQYSIGSQDKLEDLEAVASRGVQNNLSPPNFINKNMSIVRGSGKINSNEEFNILDCLMSRSHFEQPLNMASKTSLGFESAVFKIDPPDSGFKPSANDLSPIVRPINRNFDIKSREHSNHQEVSNFAIEDGSNEKPHTDKSLLPQPSRPAPEAKRPSQPKIIRANSKVNVWSLMGKTNTDYRKVIPKKEETFDEYYMYLFNKEVQKYKESLISNPYLQNFSNDLEILNNIDKYKEKIKGEAFLQIMDSFQKNVLERMEMLKEVNRYESNIQKMNSNAVGKKKMVREKFSKSFANLSFLEGSQENVSKSTRQNNRNKENIMLEKIFIGGKKKNFLANVNKGFGDEGQLEKGDSPEWAKKLSINFQEHSFALKDMAKPVIGDSLAPGFNSNKFLELPRNSSLMFVKQLSQISNNVPTKSKMEVKYSEDNLESHRQGPKALPGDGSTNVHENRSHFAMKRCMSDSEYMVLSEKMKMYDEKTRKMSVEDYQILKELGKGAYGKVYLVSSKSTQDIFAMKIIKFSQKTSAHFLTSLINEIQILKEIRGDFLAHAFCSFVENQCLCIVMEYLVGGDFRHLLEDFGRFDNIVTKHYIAQLIMGLDELHQKKIVHRDLKPENLLLDMEGRLRLADFGLSDFYAKIGENIDDDEEEEEEEKPKDEFNKLTNKIVGSPDYIPPEVLFGYEFSKSMPSTADNKLDLMSVSMVNCPSKAQPEAKASLLKAEEEKLVNVIDWWSVGCLTYEFLVGIPPFAGDSIDEVFDNIKKYQISWPTIGYDEDEITPEAKHFIERLLDCNPQTRLGYNGVDEIKTHPFFNEVDWENLAKQKAPIPLNFTMPNKKTQIKLSLLGPQKKDKVQESFFEAKDLTMKRIDLLFEMNIKQFKLLK